LQGPQRKAKPGRPGRTDEEPRARFAVASLRALEAVGLACAACPGDSSHNHRQHALGLQGAPAAKSVHAAAAQPLLGTCQRAGRGAKSPLLSLSLACGVCPRLDRCGYGDSALPDSLPARASAAEASPRADRTMVGGPNAVACSGPLNAFGSGAVVRH